MYQLAGLTPSVPASHGANSVGMYNVVKVSLHCETY